MNNFGKGLLANIPPVVKNLLIINVLLLLVTIVLESTFGIYLSHWLGLHHYKSEYFMPVQIITHMFMHGGLTHLFFNMFALYMFGRVLESYWGGKRFFIYYMVTGLGAAALHTAVNTWELSSLLADAQLFRDNPDVENFAYFLKENFAQLYVKNLEFIDEWRELGYSQRHASEALGFIEESTRKMINVPTVGASGAVFGVLLAFGMKFPNTQLMLLFPPMPIKAKWMVIAYGALELYLGFQNSPGDNVAHFAHLGGMLFGFLLIKYWEKVKPTHRQY